LPTKFFEISLLIFDLSFIIYLHIITETVDLLSYIRVQNVLATVKFTVRGFCFFKFSLIFRTLKQKVVELLSINHHL